MHRLLHIEKSMLYFKETEDKRCLNASSLSLLKKFIHLEAVHGDQHYMKLDWKRFSMNECAIECGYKWYRTVNQNLKASHNFCSMKWKEFTFSISYSWWWCSLRIDSGVTAKWYSSSTSYKQRQTTFNHEASQTAFLFYFSLCFPRRLCNNLWWWQWRWRLGMNKKAEANDSKSLQNMWFRVRSCKVSFLNLNVHMSSKLKLKCHITNEIVKRKHKLKLPSSAEHRSITKFRMYAVVHLMDEKERLWDKPSYKSRRCADVLKTIEFLTSQTLRGGARKTSQPNRKSDNLMNH